MTYNLNVSYSDYARATGMTEMNARYMLEALQTQIRNSEQLVKLQGQMARDIGNVQNNTTSFISNIGSNSAVIEQYVEAAEIERGRNSVLEGMLHTEQQRIEILKTQITEYQLIQVARDKVSKLEIDALKGKQKRIIAGREFERQQNCMLFAKYSYREKAKFYKTIKSRITELVNVSMIAYNYLNVDNSAIAAVGREIAALQKFITVETVSSTGFFFKKQIVTKTQVANPNFESELKALNDKLNSLRGVQNIEESKLLMLIEPTISMVFENPISFTICKMADRVNMPSIEVYGVLPTDEEHITDVMVVEEFEQEYNVVDYSIIKFSAIIAAKKKIAGQSAPTDVKMFKLV